MKNLIEALAKARATFTKAGKTATNKFDGYQYATIADYINAVTPALSENGLILIQKESVDCDGLFVSVKTSIHHSSGESIKFGKTICPITPKKQGAPVFTPQNVGAAITYARKYGMQVALCIASEDDADDNQPPAGGQVPPPSESPKNPYQKLCTNDKFTENKDKWAAALLKHGAEKFFAYLLEKHGTKLSKEQEDQLFDMAHTLQHAQGQDQQ